MMSAADTGWGEGGEQVRAGGCRVGVGAGMTVVDLGKQRRAPGQA